MPGNFSSVNGRNNNFFVPWRRSSGWPSDYKDVEVVPGRGGLSLLDLYDRALPQVYGYLMGRCGDRTVAEDLTSETFLTAAGAGRDVALSVGWLIGVARHKLMDHWRRQARQDRLLHAVEGTMSDADDPWEVELDRWRAREVLARLPPPYRAALTFRCLDGLGVAQVAGVLDRSVDATEAMLVRARRQFRHLYEESSDD